MQLKEDGGRRVDSPMLNTMGLKSLRYLCMEAVGQMFDGDHSDDATDNHSSEHDATTNPTTMFGKYSSVGEQVINYVQQTIWGSSPAERIADVDKFILLGD